GPPGRAVVVVVDLGQLDRARGQEDHVGADAGLAPAGGGVGVGRDDGVAERALGPAGAAAEAGHLDDPVGLGTGIGVCVGVRIWVRVGVRVGVLGRRRADG